MSLLGHQIYQSNAGWERHLAGDSFSAKSRRELHKWVGQEESGSMPEEELTLTSGNHAGIWILPATVPRPLPAAS